MSLSHMRAVNRSAKVAVFFPSQSRTAHLLLLLILANTLPTYVHAQMQKSGSVPELTWESKATNSAGTEYMFERSVVNRTAKPLWVDWPLGGCREWIATHDKWVKTIGPYTDPRAEDGKLEYTLESKKTDTTVYQYKGEPSNHGKLITAIATKVALEGKESQIVNVDLRITSEVVLKESQFIARSSFANAGDPIVLEWNNRQGVGLADATLAEPVRLAQSSSPRVLESHFKDQPIPITRSFTVRRPTGVIVLQTDGLLFSGRQNR